MDLFPHFPLRLNSTAIFGLTLILGLIGGELAKRTRIFPVISGYIIIGFLVGPGGFNIANTSVLATTRIFVDISLSLILFELGRYLDFRWLYRDRGLLPMAFAEITLTFAAIFCASYLFIHLSLLQSILAGIIAIATSPAVVMMVAHDIDAEGPVTRRTLILTSLNNLVALVLFTIILPFTKSHYTAKEALNPLMYQLFGSIILGLLMFLVVEVVACLLGKNKQNQFVLFVSIMILTASLGRIFHLSTMIPLFVLGVAARNFDRKHILMEVDFGWLARLFLIVLFVVTGVYLQLKELWGIIGAVILFILARGIAKYAGIWLFSNICTLTKQQTFAISLALTPMAGVAIGMKNTLSDFNPEFGQHLLLIITGMVAILNIVGPILTQFAFIKSGEARITET